MRFAELCGRPHGVAEYLELSRRYRCWIVCDVPVLRDVPMDWATRFVNLVDVLYDADIPLTVYAAAEPDELTQAVPYLQDLYRTASRLSELTDCAVAEGYDQHRCVESQSVRLSTVE